MSARLVVVHPDAEVLAQAAAARLLTRILDMQSVRRPVHVVLTGGTVGTAALAAAAASPLVGAVDWSGVHLWWGDERYLPTGDPDRNETQARAALVDALVASHGLPEAHVHAIAGPDTTDSPEASAAAYAAELARLADGDAAVPVFDVLLLGMGPDGHVASLFPGHEALTAVGATVAVHGSPKPPAERVSLTFDAINTAREVWVVAAGAEKAEQAAAALGGHDVTDVPASGVHGTDRTLWLLDTAASDAP
ncbi:6-phosphogluconolactonase [Xylanimonas cellulosilytica DSM 15894]|uniref:6-phosphogluconolactonase n=1 Tax=Xylanimonas cellulosilytica (strain DSM 15894 / JCM 12276 / CECT 5975 / KCTC 9989 / LMG 20990 / NBRC 107835 / XIL07) TaxID=446471 RepID=D1BS91_XYLCX|nr:6-phosphogluconolactonase [Xylanimonas cellulosilytica]ACZ30583.1 6-phosphogluconolactonase [Xylanimonas cellulosilytica DSM 15894]